MSEELIDMICRVCESDALRQEPDIDLIDSGVLDSFGFLSLLEQIEARWGVELQPSRIPGDTWRHVQTIEALVRAELKKIGAVARL